MPLPQPAAQDDTLSELLELINRQLTEKNLKIEKASAAVIDATIIQTAGSKQRQAIEVDEEGQVSGQTTPSKDKDARWTKKNGLYRLGYKQHTRTDEEGYIEKLHITPANIRGGLRGHLGKIRRYWGRETAENLCLGFGCWGRGFFAKVSFPTTVWLLPCRFLWTVKQQGRLKAAICFRRPFLLAQIGACVM